MRAVAVGVPSSASAAGSKPSRSSSASSAAQAAARLGCGWPASTPQARPVVGGVVGVGADPLGQRGEQPGEQRVGRRVEAERRARRRRGSRGAGAGRPCPRWIGLDVDQAGFAQALEVEAHGVGVQAERVGEILARRAASVERGQLAVHRVARLVAERLEHRELVHRA